MATTIRAFAYVGMAAPYSVEIDISPSPDGVMLPDLTVVTGVSLSLGDTPLGPLTWTASIVQQTATLLRVSHLLASDGSDIATAGSYWITPKLSTPSGVQWGDPVLLLVKVLP